MSDQAAAALPIGVIADTHGLLRPEALAALQGCRHILHAGDIGDLSLLAALQQIAPVTAVRGNNDKGDRAAGLPETALLQLGGAWIYMIHDLAELDIDPVAAGVAIVVSGHSHKPLARERDGVLYFNPGSAGPRRFSLPISLGRLLISGGIPSWQLIDLPISSPAPRNRA